MTVKTALWPLQTAVFERLDNDTVLKEMVNGVFDEIEEGTQLPFIQIGDDTVNPYDTKTSHGEELTLTIHAWSAGPGKTEAKRIMSEILRALTAEKIELTDGFKLEEMKRDFLEVFNDGQVYHGVCRFRVYVKQL